MPCWWAGSGRYVVGGNSLRGCILWMGWTARSDMLDDRWYCVDILSEWAIRWHVVLDRADGRS